MSRPVRLAKKQNVSPVYNICEKLEAFILSHASFFFILALIVLMILFVVLCYKIVGISCLESGSLRNFINRGV